MSRPGLALVGLIATASACACGSSSDALPDGGAQAPDADVPPAHAPRLAYQSLARVYLVSWKDGQPSEPVQASPLVGTGDNDFTIFRWSPRGDWLLVRATGRVQLVDARGDRPGPPVDVAPGTGTSVWFASFAPSGSRVLIETAGTVPEDHTISIADILPNGTVSPTRNVLSLGARGFESYAWAPDSKHVAVVASDGSPGSGELWVADTESPTPSMARQLAAHVPVPSDASRPMKWCADSQRLFFVERTRADNISPLQLWSRTLIGDQLTSAQRINPPLGPDDEGVFGWSQAPDCRGVAYSGNGSAVLVDTHDGGAASPSIGWNTSRELSWSADSRWVVIGHEPSGASAPVAEIYDTSSGVPGISTSIADGAPAAEFVWSPDARQLSYRAEGTPSRRFIVDLSVEGIGAPVPLPLAPGLSGVALAPGSPWSSDGSHLAYLASSLSDPAQRHYVVVDLTTQPMALLDLGPATSIGVGTELLYSTSPWAQRTHLLVYLADRGELFDPSLVVRDVDRPGDEPMTIFTGTLEDWAWAP